MWKKVNRTIGIVFILFCLLVIIRSFYSNHELENDFAVSVGKVNKVSNVLRQSGNWYFSYEYDINGKKFPGEGIHSLCGNLTLEKLRAFLVNKSFPVAYSRKDTSTSVMILTKDLADKFKYDLPDSLLMYDSILTCK